jgi:hypothetical protein
MNNPLIYKDENGESILAIIGIAAVIGGAFNVWSHQNDIHGFGDFAKYFGVGAVSGAVAGGLGAISLGIGGVIGGTLSGMMSGAGGGFLLGGGNSLIQYGDFGHFWDDAFSEAFTGVITGGIIGGVVGGVSAYLKGNKIMTGKVTTQDHGDRFLIPPAIKDNSFRYYDVK